MNKLILVLSVLLVIAGCDTTKKVEISAKPIKESVILAPKPSPTNISEFNIKIITKDNIEEFISDIKTKQSLKDDSYVFYAITPKEYEQLVANVQDLKRYIQESNSIIIYYEEVLKERK